LISGKKPDHDLPHQSLKYKLYDATLLKILADKKYTGREVFGNLFQKNGIQSMFRFLDEETTLTEELKIMSSTPIIDFGRAFFHQLGK
jgi:lycopene beta-cyclase